MIEKECVFGREKYPFCGGPTEEGCSQIKSLHHQRLHGGDWSSKEGQEAWRIYVNRLGKVLQEISCPHTNKIEEMAKKLAASEGAKELA